MKRIIIISVLLVLSITTFAQNNSELDPTEPYFTMYYGGLTPEDVNLNLKEDNLTYVARSDLNDKIYGISYLKASTVTPALFLYFDKGTNRCVYQVEPIDNSVVLKIYKYFLEDERFVQIGTFSFLIDHSGKTVLVEIKKTGGITTLVREDYKP
jgi:hypothetical protein